MAGISFEINGVAKLNDKLQKVVSGVSSFKKPLNQAGIYFMRQTGLAFEQEGRGEKWKPLKESTIRRRRRGGGKGRPRILRDQGRLSQSFTKGGQGNIFVVSDDQLRFGTNLDYAQYHQEGTKNMPARPMLEILPEDEEAVTKIFDDYISGLI